jgi:hypothetical protein
MSRIPLPFHTDDMSALARSLGGQLAACDHRPGHVELLNMLARSAGFRNFQHFRSRPADSAPVAGPVAAPVDVVPPPATPPGEPVDLARVRRLLRLFDEQGRLATWPSKQSHQELCLWVLWSRIPARQVRSEPEINRLLEANHRFADYALLRRWLCDYGMMTRTADGREYRRIERAPSAEAQALIRLTRPPPPVYASGRPASPPPPPPPEPPMS